MEPQLAVLRTFTNKFEADVALSALQAAGIDAVIRSDDCDGLQPGLWLAGIDILVRAEDVTHAAEVLEGTTADDSG